MSANPRDKGGERVTLAIFREGSPLGPPITRSRKDKRYIGEFGVHCKAFLHGWTLGYVGIAGDGPLTSGISSVRDDHDGRGQGEATER